MTMDSMDTSKWLSSYFFNSKLLPYSMMLIS